MRGSAASNDGRQQYNRLSSWPAPKVHRSSSSKSVPENPTSPQSAPIPPTYSRKFYSYFTLMDIFRVFTRYQKLLVKNDIWLMKNHSKFPSNFIISLTHWYEFSKIKSFILQISIVKWVK